MNQKQHAPRLSEEKWHSLEAADVYEELQSRLEGLDAQEAAQRLQFYGPNKPCRQKNRQRSGPSCCTRCSTL